MKSESLQSNNKPLNDKGDPSSPLLKYKEKPFKLNPYRNLIFNPSCCKDMLNEHLKKVHTSLVYGMHHLKKPNASNLHAKYVCLGEMKRKLYVFLNLNISLILKEF